MKPSTNEWVFRCAVVVVAFLSLLPGSVMVASGAGGQGHASELSPLVARHLPVATDSSPTSVPVADARLADGDASSNASKAVAATISVGSAPYGVAYDSRKGEVFVANLG